jgi:hypothetical protein
MRDCKLLSRTHEGDPILNCMVNLALDSGYGPIETLVKNKNKSDQGLSSSSFWGWVRVSRNRTRSGRSSLQLEYMLCLFTPTW